MNEMHDATAPATGATTYDPAKYPGKRDESGQLCCSAEGCWRYATINGGYGWVCSYHATEHKAAWHGITRLISSDAFRILDTALLHCMSTARANESENNEWIAALQKLALRLGMDREVLSRRVIVHRVAKAGTNLTEEVEEPEPAHAFASRIRAALVGLVKRQAEAAAAPFRNAEYRVATRIERASDVIARITSNIQQEAA